MKMETDWLTPNRYSRPQRPMKEIRGIVLHWVANPRTSAKANRDYFESRKSGTLGFGSAHEIIGLKGEVVLCIPEGEMAYHVGARTYCAEAVRTLSTYPNNCTYGIELCHIDWEGRMTRETMEALLVRLAILCKRWKLDPVTALYRHHEIVGFKDCPRWWVRHQADWQAMKWLVRSEMETGENCMTFK